MLALLAALPIIIVGVLMIGYMWPASKAMPFGWLSALIIAAIGWGMPVKWLSAATIGGVINAFSILLIVFWGSTYFTVDEKKWRSIWHFSFYDFDFSR